MILVAPPFGRALRRLLAAGALACLILLATPGAADAHAGLEGGSIADGEVLETAPEEVFLDFNEGISAPRAGLRVYDDTGARVDVGGTFQTDGSDDQVRVGLQEDLPDGTYVLTYRVTSADGHPVDGALVFSIGEETGASDELVAQVFTGAAERPWAVAAAAARGVMYLGTLLAAGAALALWWLRDEAAPEAAALRWIGRGAWAALIATVVGVAVQVVLVTGDGIGSLGDAGAVSDTLVSFVGLSAGLRILAAILLIVLSHSARLATGWGAAAAIMILASLLLEGHTLTTGPAAVVWIGAAVHVVAGAVWLGGLVVLAVVLRHRRRADDPVGAGRVVARFSSIFTASVVAVVVAGVALSWAEVRAVRALVDTSYGLVLLAKLAAVVPLIALGAWNNRRLVPVLTARRRRTRSRSAPAIAGGSDEAADPARDRDAAWQTLRRTARIEVGLIAVVLGITGVLVSLQPAAEAAGITGAYSETVDFPGIGQMTFTVDPNRAGQNEIHLDLLGDTGRPVDALGDDPDAAITMHLSQPVLDIGPITREPVFAGPGHYVLSGPELNVPGLWEITVEVAPNRFDLHTATVEVTVNP